VGQIGTEPFVCGELRNEALLQGLLDTRLPLVLVSPSLSTTAADVVEIDNVGGAIQAVNHLVELGHRQIAFIGGTPTSRPAKEREEGYSEGLQKAGLPSHPSLRLFTGWRLEDGYAAMESLLARDPSITAVFAASDLLALGACQAAAAAGLVVPQDLSVIGFDDISLAAETQPSLSTVRVLMYEMGELAAQFIFDILAGKRAYSLRANVPTELVVRDSTGPVAAVR
jgi:LacI family transcriptional regulator